MAFLLSLEAIAGLIFALTYLLFLAGMRSKTVAALLGAMLMVGFGVLGYTDIGGVYGTKFVNLPGSANHYGFWAMIGLTPAISGGMLGYFRWRGWF